MYTVHSKNGKMDVGWQHITTHISSPLHIDPIRHTWVPNYSKNIGMSTEIQFQLISLHILLNLLKLWSMTYGTIAFGQTRNVDFVIAFWGDLLLLLSPAWRGGLLVRLEILTAMPHTYMYIKVCVCVCCECWIAIKHATIEWMV